MMALLIFHSTVDGMDVNHSGASIPLGSWWLCFYSTQLLMLWLLNHRSYSFTWLLMVELLFRSVVIPPTRLIMAELLFNAAVDGMACNPSGASIPLDL
jgi:hypothetical protein